MRGEKKPRTNFPLMRAIAARLKLRLCPDSAFIFSGDCPLCGGSGTLVLHMKRNEIRCGACGLEGGFGPAPEAPRRRMGEAECS